MNRKQFLASLIAVPIIASVPKIIFPENVEKHRIIYSPETLQDLRAYGYDIEQEMVDIISSQIGRDIDKEILNKAISEGKNVIDDDFIPKKEIWV